MSNESTGAVLISGATGFVGSQVLAHFLDATDRTIWVPVRARTPQEAHARVASKLSSIYGPDADARLERCRPIMADLERPNLGLPPPAHDAVTESVTSMIHCAAALRWDLSLDRAREVNVRGTERMLQLAAACASRGDLEVFAHVSTAYVAGQEGETFREADRPSGPWRNTYETSKAEGEALVRRDGLPTIILRPSIVTGERQSGYTSAWGLLYPLLKAILRGSLVEIPADPMTRLDIVPVDWLAEAIVKACQRPPTSQVTYHLAAGARSITIGELVKLVGETTGRFVRLTDPGREAVTLMARFAPYLVRGPQFTNDETLGVLDMAGPPALSEYIELLVAYAERARFGREPMTRAAARAWAAELPR